MEMLNSIISAINGFVWGPVMISLLVGAGIWLSVGTKFVQFRKMPQALKHLLKKNDHDGDISPFQALMTSLAATIGTGNIAGVASAIALGGPGAVFWMWVTAAFGGATKFSEALLALKYRVSNEAGEKSGGPMYYIENGLGPKWKWMAVAFAVFAVIASFGIGNMVQANSVADSLKNSTGISPHITGVVAALLAGLVILGGIRSIARVTEKVVPVMAVIYVAGSLVILIINAEQVPQAFAWIFGNAFSSKAVAGGVLGAVIRFGVARGIFSNEAGLGSAPIAHAASRNADPVSQGLIGSLGSFFDTLIICTMTALVILTSGLVQIDPDTGLMSITENLTSAALTTRAFQDSLPGPGGFIVSFGLIFFAFSTILGWFYYGSKALEYLFGVKAVKYYKVAWILLIYIGATLKVGFVWNLSDTFNGMMALPNLIALLLLSPVVFKLLKESEAK